MMKKNRRKINRKKKIFLLSAHAGQNGLTLTTLEGQGISRISTF